MIRVVIADDQALVRAGFRMILECAGDMVIIGEAETGAAALALIDKHSPDVVLMDIRMPELDGLDAWKPRAAFKLAHKRRTCSSSPPSTPTNTSTRHSRPAPPASCSRQRPLRGSSKRSES